MKISSIAIMISIVQVVASMELIVSPTKETEILDQRKKYVIETRIRTKESTKDGPFMARKGVFHFYSSDYSG